jgi:multiple antibiotic resistance protein
MTEWHAWARYLVGPVVIVNPLPAVSVGDRVSAVLGTIGMNIATRIMGLLAAAIAVAFITHGLKTLLPGLT